MSQKLWRVVRACVELGPTNPLQQIHDQGAGGNCNVVKEIIYPLGAKIDVRQVRHLHWTLLQRIIFAAKPLSPYTQRAPSICTDQAGR